MTEHDDPIDDPLLEELRSLRPAPLPPAFRKRLSRPLEPRRDGGSRSTAKAFGVVAAAAACGLAALVTWWTLPRPLPIDEEIADRPPRPAPADDAPAEPRHVRASVWSYHLAVGTSMDEFESLLTDDADRLLPGVGSVEIADVRSIDH